MRVIGNQGLEERIRDLVLGKKVNRTFLFLGQRDAGKTFMGKFFASLILDNRVFRNAHPDFFYFKGTSGKYSSLLEDFLEACHKQPFEKDNVVVFFDDIDLIPLNSLNVLLKTLEEPPLKTTIIISAKSQESLLDTIISRSFKLPLLPKTREEKAEILFSKGIKDGFYRLAISDDIKICASKDFLSLEEKVGKCFKYFDNFLKLKDQDLIKEINSLLENIDLKFFFESIRFKSCSLNFQSAVAQALRDCAAFNNKYLILFNFVMFLKDGF